MRSESASALRERFASSWPKRRPRRSGRGCRRPSSKQPRDEATAAARAAAHARDDLARARSLAKERLAALERSLAEREGIPPAARALADEGAELALSLLDVDSGNERAVAAALAWRASAVMADDAAAGLALLQRAREAGLGSLAVLIGKRPAERVAELPVVPLDALLSATVASVTAEGFGFDPQRGELWFAGEAAEAVLLELESRRRELEQEVTELEAQAQLAEREAAETAARAEEAEAAYAQVAHLRAARAADPALLRRLAAGADRLDEALIAAVAVAARLEQPLRARADAGAKRAAELGTDLRRRRWARARGAPGVDARERARRRRRARASTARRRGSDQDAARRRTRARAGRARGSRADRGGRAARRARGRGRRGRTRRGGRHRGASCRRARRRPRASRCSPAPSDWTRRSPQRPPQLPASTHRCGHGSTRARPAPASSAHSSAIWAPPRLRCDRAPRTRLSVSTEIEIELTRIEGEAADARRRLGEAGAETAEGDDRDELAARVERLEQRRIQLGQVNPLAKEEYDAEKERLAELEVQREDLEQSLKELADLRDELAETVERRFAETFQAVAEHFEDVAATLFPGGEGRLRLVEPEDEGGETGVEVELRPAGKRITRLGMLSGGEKALGAISFLFALFLAKPCPFYLLDEVEAALDDANIGRFVELLRRYADRAQFVVITHQKRTMEAADVLYGVTMGGDGVSQIVSRRLPREEAVAAAS